MADLAVGNLENCYLENGVPCYWFLVRHAIYVCCSYATSITSMCLYIVSVTLVNCDHVVKWKAEVGKWKDRSVSWLPAR